MVCVRTARARAVRLEHGRGAAGREKYTVGVRIAKATHSKVSGDISKA